MKLLDGIGLKWLTNLLKKYININKSMTGDTIDTEIKDYDDLNDYTTIGNYYCRPDLNDVEVANCPSTNSFILKVYSCNGYGIETSDGSYLTQYLENNVGVAWRRYKLTDDWSDWEKIVTTNGSDDVGSGTNPIYVKDNPMASGSSVGSGIKPIHLSDGNFTASSSNVGSASKLSYLNSGVLSESNSSVGSGTQPIFLNKGILEALSATIGSNSVPVYLKSGIFTACTSVGSLSVSEYSLGEKGYVKFSIGLIVQWGTRNTTGSSSDPYTITYPVKFSSSSSYVIVKNCKSTNYSGNMHDNIFSFYSKTASGATTYQAGSNNEEWIAVGY